MAVMAQKLAGFIPLPEKARTLPQNVRASPDKDRTPPEKTPPLPEPATELAEPIFTPPDYTMKEIYAAIPEHCLHPSTFWSIFYVLRDVAMILALFYAATFIEYVPEKWMRNLLWVSYSIVQGFVFTGIWELAHEAGHGALSENKFINHTMGLLIHSALLVPYHSWRFTHSYHHKSTNNLDGDVAFVPDRKEDWEKKREKRWKIQDWTEDMPIVALLTLIIHQIVAWPLYLTINNFALKRIAAAPWWKRSHFYWGGDGPEFRPENTREVIISNCAILVMVGILWAAVKQFGGWNVMCYYGFPYMWENHWILTITFLQHTDVVLPYYPAEKWTFLKGAASAVDREFGFIGNFFFHGTTGRHVVHHHVSRIPFYYTPEANEAVKKVMGKHYQSDHQTPYLWAFWKNKRDCKYVEETEPGSGVYMFNEEEERVS